MSSSVSIGQLRHRIIIQAPADMDDGAGGFVRSWVEHARLWAAIEPALAPEQVVDAAEASSVTYRFTVRFRSGIAPSMRIMMDERSYNITACADPDGRRQWLDILATEDDR